MKRKSLFLVMVILATSFSTRGGDTNFVAAFNTQWCSKHASNILSYAESQVATNREVETLFARALAAAYLQKWGRGATNYFGQAIFEAQSNTTYSVSGRSNVVQMITETKGYFEALADDSAEPTNSVPSWDTNYHAVIFGQVGDEAPSLTTLERIANTQ